MEDNTPELLDDVLADAEAASPPPLTRRDAALPEMPGKASAVIGMRRVGKSSLLHARVAALLARGVPRTRILHVEFEDERLSGLTDRDLHLLEDAFHRRHPDSDGQPCWYLFDEIQNVKGWERFVRRLLGNRNLQLTLTGSSAKLLSTEIATSLRGRSLTTELWPFSFREYVRHHGTDIPTKWPPSSAIRTKLRAAFDGYLRTGGFPEVQSAPMPLWRQILQGYVDVVILRDVAERHSLGNVPLLRALVRRLLRSVSRQTSINGMVKDLRSQGFTFGKDAIYELFEHLQDAFLIATLPLASLSEKRQQVNPRKLYVADHGLAAACAPMRAEDQGNHLENIVFLELHRRGGLTGYHTTATGREVDFVVQRPDGKVTLVQVCASMAAAATRERELDALAEAFAETKATDGLILTLDDQGQESIADRKVRITSAWRWLLQPPA